MREPLPGEIGRALRTLGLDTFRGEPYRGAFDIIRIYDRSSGNFKAIGWRVTAGYGFDLDDGRSFVTTLTIGLPDELLAFRQSGLDEF